MLGSHNHIKTGMVAPAYNPRTWEVHTGGSEVQGHPHLHREFEARLGCVRPTTTTEWGKIMYVWLHVTI